jgi:hypothetical protein
MTPPKPRISPDEPPVGRITCPQCRSRLDVAETSSGGRTVSVAVVAVLAEPQALELFTPPASGPHITCPSCSQNIDPAAPYRGNCRGAFGSEALEPMMGKRRGMRYGHDNG